MERYQQSLVASYARLDSRPIGALSGPVERMLHDGDHRFGVPPRDQAEMRTLDELRAWLDPMLRHGPMQVSVVGDIEPAQVIEEVGRTFGALPSRGPEVAAPVPPDLRMPDLADPQRFTHNGPAGQAIAAVYWPTTGRTDAPTAIGLDLVAAILGDRLLDEVRTREGATYSPETFSDMSLAIPSYGVLGAVLDVEAPDAERFATVIRDVAAGMAKGGITQDELDRAKQPRLSRARASMQSNEYWLKGVLVGLTQFPQRLEEARRLTADVEGQTLESVQALASRYLDPAKALDVLVVPARSL
jgi:zinc protease